MNSNHHKFIQEATESYNNCTGGKWFDANKFDLQELEGLAKQAMKYVSECKWEDAFRWAKRCVEMEKKVGFNHAPIWGEFSDTIERIYNEISKSNSQ